MWIDYLRGFMTSGICKTRSNDKGVQTCNLDLVEDMHRNCLEGLLKHWVE
jgi:hypothetical protein